MTTARGSGLQPMEMVLDWLPNVQFAGPCWALAHGLYREAGIDLALVPWEEDGRGIIEKTCARNMPAMGSSEDNLVISAAARGEANLSALAAMFLTTPLVLMSRSEAPITSIGDLRGKRVAIHCDGLHILEGLLRLHGIGANEVEVTEVANALANLTSGRFDAVQGYSVCEPLEHAALGLRPATLVMRHKELHPYSQVMFVPSDALTVVPDLYRAALDVTFAGWQSAMADPAGAAAAIRAVGAPMTDPALEAVALGLVADLVRGAGADGARGLGRIDPARWAANVAAYVADGLVPKGTSPDCGLRADFWIDTPDSGRDDTDRAARAGAGA